MPFENALSGAISYKIFDNITSDQFIMTDEAPPVDVEIGSPQQKQQVSSPPL